MMKRILINNLFYRVIDDIADYVESLKKELKDQRAKADILEEDNKQLMAQISAKAEQELVKCEYCRGRGNYYSSSAINPGYVRCPTCNGTGVVMHKTTNAAIQTPLSVSDATQFKVGDWMEIKDIDNTPLQAVVTEIYKYNFICKCNNGKVFSLPAEKSIYRRLSPSEVIVKIGCLSGTVRPVSINGIHIWFQLIGVDDKIIATIRISYLDPATAAMVRELIEKQEGDEK
jgi:predicted methyltransferase